MIIHIDMDAFYASVEIRDNPQLQGKPIVVGGSPQGRGVVSAANYVARQFGVHSAMPAAQAIRLCPEAVFVKPRMDRYVNVSRQIREIFNRFTPLVEPISLDEAFLDVSGSESLFGTATEIAQQVKRVISEELDLVASVGVAPNKFVAKVASDLDKPNGLVVVSPDQVQPFLDPLAIRRVWGIGPKTEAKFQQLGVSTVAGIRGLSKKVLEARFGLNADHFWRLSRGLDSRPVVAERSAKSISHETTFSKDIIDNDCLHAWVIELAELVAMRLRSKQIKGKTIQVKVRYSDFRTITRSKTLTQPTYATRQIQDVACELMSQVRQESSQPVRLVGVAVGGLKLKPAIQQNLFDAEQDQKMARVDEARDQILAKFGKGKLRSAAAMQHQVNLRRNPTTDDQN